MILTLNTGLLTGLCSVGSLIAVEISLLCILMDIDVDFFVATGGSRHIHIHRLVF